MFRRDKSQEPTKEQQDLSGDRTKAGPTPSRKKAEAERQRPLVPADRKAAKRAARAKRDERFQREQEALRTGDERYLPYRDKGKVRRYVRDWVDARYSFSEFVFPVMMIFLASFFVISFWRGGDSLGQIIIMTATIVMYALIALAIVESAFVWMRVKKRLAEDLPNEVIPRRTWFYMFSRMIMLRPWRSAAPQVARGAFPGRGKHSH